ncbi:hypothetical protein [Shimazuella kribbensis]|uniref:hypothetical protein n=1 Tax=Shimazuella kribbensis TaxID=139808 RepID=UPI000413820A|nr:hypothetical protein [Shimazuella kribbensis]
MKRKVAIIARIVFGVFLLGVGLSNLLGLMPTMQYPEAANRFMTALTGTGYMMGIVSILNVLVGVSMLLNRFVPLALVVFTPISVNMVLFHLFLDIKSILPAWFRRGTNWIPPSAHLSDFPVPIEEGQDQQTLQTVAVAGQVLQLLAYPQLPTEFFGQLTAGDVNAIVPARCLRDGVRGATSQSRIAVPEKSVTLMRSILSRFPSSVLPP